MSHEAAPLLSLVEDDRLVLAVQPAAHAAVRSWLPRLDARAPADAGVEVSRIEVVADGAQAPQRPAGEPAIRVLDLSGWVEREHVLLRSAEGAVSALVEPGRSRARVRVPGGEVDAETARQAFAALTVTAALLLGRRGRCLLHAAGAVDPAGRAWLIVGDCGAGKSTSCANLVRAGWRFLADDQVIVRRRTATGFHAEGWPRSFNLDTGYFEGRPTGLRGPVTPASLRADAWRRSAPVAGLLFPRVRPDRPTALEPIRPAEALEALIRQSPWLLADRPAAAGLLSLLEDLAALPVYRLRLGSDSFDAPARLAEVVHAAAIVGDQPRKDHGIVRIA